MKITLVASTVLVSLSYVSAWGNDGHTMIGAVADSLLTSQGKAFVQQVLGSDTLSSVATWADQVKRTSQYAFTVNWHFIDTNDSPSTSCSYDAVRDASNDDNLIHGIAQYANQIRCANQPSADQQAEGLRFITHFIGDLAQPLHVCGRERGGNNIKVTFSGSSRSSSSSGHGGRSHGRGRRSSGHNLHAIWDTNMIEKTLKEQYGNDENQYAGALLQKAQSLNLQACSTNLLATDSQQRYPCVAEWASDTNSINCAVVWKPVEDNPDQDFAKDYYENVKDTIDVQLATAGFRLASLVNAIAAESC